MFYEISYFQEGNDIYSGLVVLAAAPHRDFRSLCSGGFGQEILENLSKSWQTKKMLCDRKLHHSDLNSILQEFYKNVD